MYSQSMDEFVQLIYKWSEFTPQLEQIYHVGMWIFNLEWEQRQLLTIHQSYSKIAILKPFHYIMTLSYTP